MKYGGVGTLGKLASSCSVTTSATVTTGAGAALKQGSGDLGGGGCLDYPEPLRLNSWNPGLPNLVLCVDQTLLLYGHPGDALTH